MTYCKFFIEQMTKVCSEYRWISDKINNQSNEIIQNITELSGEVKKV